MHWSSSIVAMQQFHEYWWNYIRAEYCRDREGFLELLLEYGANYNLSKSNNKKSVWEAFGNVIQWT